MLFLSFQTHWTFQTYWVESISTQSSRVIRTSCSSESSVSHKNIPPTSPNPLLVLLGGISTWVQHENNSQSRINQMTGDNDKFDPKWQLERNKGASAIMHSPKPLPYWMVCYTLKCLHISCNSQSIRPNQERDRSAQQPTYQKWKQSETMKKMHMLSQIYREHSLTFKLEVVSIPVNQ